MKTLEFIALTVLTVGSYICDIYATSGQQIACETLPFDKNLPSAPLLLYTCTVIGSSLVAYDTLCARPL